MLTPKTYSSEIIRHSSNQDTQRPETGGLLGRSSSFHLHRNDGGPSGLERHWEIPGRGPGRSRLLDSVSPGVETGLWTRGVGQKRKDFLFNTMVFDGF